MDRPPPRRIVDARPAGPEGLHAGAPLFGRPVVARHVEAVARLGLGPVIVLARPGDQRDIQAFLDGSTAIVETAGPRPGDVLLRTDRIYHPTRLAKLLHRGADPEPAAIWRLDRPGAWASAESEVRRRLTYQPIGRFWAWAPARRLAEALRPTAVQPNQVTIAAGLLMLGAAGLVALGGDSGWGRLLIALAMASALVLDTADGHLARLQGTASAFGRLLDAVLDEACDLALHAAIAWATFARTGTSAWLLLGTAYVAGKFLFVVTANEADRDAPSGRAPDDPLDPEVRPSPLAAAVRLAGHADIRWHLWIALGAIGRLDLALVAYTAYFAARATAIVVRKGRGRHAVA